MSLAEFRLRARNRPILLDGGLSTVLEEAGVFNTPASSRTVESPPSSSKFLSASDSLWTSRLLMEDPQALEKAHERFLTAGAEVISTATYQASQKGFSLAHVVHDDSFGLMRSAVAIANDAREKVGASQSSTNRSPLIALSLGPYAASLGGGAEYRNPTEASSEDLRFFHRRRAHVFFANTDVPQSKDAKTFPDVVAYETFNSAREAVIVTEIMRTDLALAALPFWITFHCSTDGLIASGETLKDAVDQILVANNSNPYLIGIGVNCCQPQKLNFLVGEIRRAIEEAVNMSSTELPELYTFAYPNSGEEWIEDMDGGAGGGRYVWPGNQPISEAEWAQFVLNSGADFVGGCCRCGASHIASLAAAVREKLCQEH